MQAKKGMKKCLILVQKLQSPVKMWGIFNELHKENINKENDSNFCNLERNRGYRHYSTRDIQ